MPLSPSVQTFTTARDLVDFLIHDVDEGCIFRGQADDVWGLSPSAWRPAAMSVARLAITLTDGENWSDLFSFLNDRNGAVLAERYLGATDAVSVERIRDLAIALHAELMVVNRFAWECDRIGLHLPVLDVSTLSSWLGESKSIWPSVDGDYSKSFVREVPIFEPTTMFAMAQHLGLPTRLLDFSDSSLKAAFFAAKGVDGGEGHIAVWMLARPDRDAFRSGLLAGDTTSSFRVLRSHVPFLHAQDGLFLTCNESANRFFLQHGRWPDFLEVMEGWKATKLRLPASEALALSACLRRLGIDKSTMMPSFEKVATALQRNLGYEAQTRS